MECPLYNQNQSVSIGATIPPRYSSIGVKYRQKVRNFAIKLKVFLFFMLHGTNRVNCSEKNKNLAHEDNYVLDIDEPN